MFSMCEYVNRAQVLVCKFLERMFLCVSKLREHVL